jgi:ribose 5-phosphate isomerase B
VAVLFSVFKVSFLLFAIVTTRSLRGGFDDVPAGVWLQQRTNGKLFEILIEDRQMKLVIGSDHAGVDLKNLLTTHLTSLGHETIDVGTYTTDPVDYPDYAEKVGNAVLNGSAERGILICGSGVGASVAANKIPDIRAGLCHDVYSAHQGVEHDDMNVLVLGARVIGPQTAIELADAYTGARFTGEERHVRRLQKVHLLEERFCDKERQA